MVGFPIGVLYADDLNDALNYMFTNQMYDELVLYLEACESGSMFENILSTDINIYATTASNGELSSYAAYCYPFDKVNGIHVGSCLGDLYSVTWMEDTDVNDIKLETLTT